MSVTASTTLGSYRLVAELGHGGMADVYLAVAQGPAGSGFTKLAVIKKLRENLAEDPDFVAMLMDEARITARLSHPNVVQLFEVGQEKDTYFLAIEYLDGQPLHRISRRAKREHVDVPPELYYVVVSDVLAGLHHAHELADYDGSPLAIVHRDVTPHNIFVTYDGTVKVVDFGIAKAMGRATETKQGIVKGKVPYMSPEQVSGGHVDRRTDIFAVGVILWNAATGTKLWADLDEIGIVRALCSGRYDASPRAICPAVPEEIDAICRKALALHPEDRYRTAAEMRADLEAYLGQSAVGARKRLETTMKELFAPERAKLRSVLEAARLTTVASTDTFAAATAAQRTEEENSDPEIEDEHTKVMPNAPPRPPPGAFPEPPSIGAIALPTPSAPVYIAPVATSSARSKPQTPRAARLRSNRAMKVALALIVVSAIALIVALGRARTNEDTSAEHNYGRTTTVVVPDPTPLSPLVRPKMQRGNDAPPDKSDKPGADKPGANVRDGRRPVARHTPDAPPESSAPTPARSDAPPAHARVGPPTKLDETDPWRAKND